MVIEAGKSRWSCNGPYAGEDVWFMFDTEHQGSIRLRFSWAELNRLHTMITCGFYEKADPGYHHDARKRFDEAMAVLAATEPRPGS